jgi:hypothetical protein
MDFISEFIFGRVFGFLDGYKTYLFGLYLIMKGVFGLCGHYWPDMGFDALPVHDAQNYIDSGLAALCVKSAIVKSGPNCK